MDKLRTLVDCTATVFQVLNERGDLLRVATKIAANGTYIPGNSPVAQAISSGRGYQGRAYVVDAWYLTSYEPLRAPDGRVIGALYVGVLQENVAALRQAIKNAGIGKNDYLFVVGGRGEEQISKAVRDQDSTVQHNAASAEELASTSEELSGQAEHLRATIGYFRLNDSGIVRSRTLRLGEPTRSALPSRRAATALAPALSERAPALPERKAMAIRAGNEGTTLRAAGDKIPA